MNSRQKFFGEKLLPGNEKWVIDWPVCSRRFIAHISSLKEIRLSCWKNRIYGWYVSDIGPVFNLKASKVFYGPQIRRFQIHPFQTKTLKEIRLIVGKIGFLAGM